MTFVHEKAHVDDSVVLGEGTRVWQFASITRGTVMGRNCSVSPGAMLDGSEYGDNVIISAGVAAGAGFLVADDVFIGPNVTLCNDLWPYADKDGYDDDALRDRNNNFAVIVHKGAAIGAGAIILPGVVIGQRAVIGAGCVVGRSVNDDVVFNGRTSGRVPPDWKEKRMRFCARFRP